jgi:predicted AlkP superfamily phosphohydrolase/phosphomutase
MMASMGGRLLVVGWDGADWQIVDDLISRALLPNVAQMVRSGAAARLTSTVPTHSWAAWPTFLTGMSPGGHAVFDFMERHATKRGKRSPIFSTAIRAETFLERLSRHGVEVRAGNIPVTFPPVPVNGRVIAGGGIPPGASFVHPPEWAPELERMAPFPTNGLEWTHYRRRPASLVEEARSLVERRNESFLALLEGNWRVAVCVFVAPDRLQHPFGNYLIPSHPEHAGLADTNLADSIRSVYAALDRSLGRLREAAGEHATTVLMSDHGFDPVIRASSVNAILVRQGFAAPNVAASAARPVYRSAIWHGIRTTRLGSLIRRVVRTPSALNWANTFAYGSVTGGGVSINLEGREPEGIVKKKDFERVREEVRQALLEFEDAEHGRPIAIVHRSEEIFSGPFANLAPDLMAMPNPLWVLDHTDAAATRVTWPTGDHGPSGILVAEGGGVVPGSLGTRDLADVAPTALAFCDVPFARLDGRSIREIAGKDPVEDEAVRASVEQRRPGELTDEEQESVAQHLRSLGYVD